MNDNYQYYDGSSNVLIHAPHGGKVITDFARGSLIIDEDEMKSELLAMTDSHTDRMALDISSHAYAYGSKHKTTPVFRNLLSRLVVDPERFPDEREEMNAVGMGAVYTHGSQRQQIRVEHPAIAEKLIKMYFKNYADVLQYHVDTLLNRHDKTTIVDLHSYASVALPYELHKEDHRPQICIGVDNYHTGEIQVAGVQSILHEKGYETSINKPFAGTYVPLKHYGQDDRVSSLMLEIRRDIYMDEKDAELKPEEYQKLVMALAEVVDFLTFL